MKGTWSPRYRGLRRPLQQACIITARNHQKAERGIVTPLEDRAEERCRAAV
jgi:hypothetical protein